MFPTVVHFNETYTLPFIYYTIRNHQKYRSFVLCRKISKNNQYLFPFEGILSSPSLYDIENLVNRAFMKYFKGIKLINNPYAYIDAIKMLDSCSILHAHFGNEGYYALSVAKRLNLPLVVTFYGGDMSDMPNIKIWNKRLFYLFKNGDAFIVEGESMKNKMIELGCPEKKLHVVRIGIQLNETPYSPRSIPRPGEDLIILMCANFVEKKGFPIALRAFKEINSIFKKTRLVIIGDGKLINDINSLIVELNLSEKVNMLGRLSLDQFFKESKKAHIFLQPSITDSKGGTEGGAPTTLIQMQASGLPIISTFHADIPNVVINGKAGLLSPEKDVSSLIDNLKHLISNPQLWNKFGQYGRRFVEKHHDVTTCVKQIEMIYDDLIHKRVKNLSN